MYMEILTIEQQQQYFQMAQQMEYEGDYESAGELYGLVMTSAFETQDYPFYIETALRAMSIDMNMRNYDEAYMLTEVLKEHIEAHGSREQYIIFENIRLSVRHNLNIEDATTHFERLLQQAYEIESIQQIFSVGNNLIYCYNSKGYYEDAIVLIESMKVYLEGLIASDDSIPIFMFWINFFSLYLEYENIEKMEEALTCIEATVALNRLPRLIYHYWSAKAYYALLSDSYTTAKYYFEKAYQSLDTKSHLIGVLTEWIALIKKHGHTEDLVYYQELLIDALNMQLANDERLTKARMVSQMTTTAFERKLHTDRLSGVKNRTFYEEQMEKHWQVTHYTFVVFDIDRFKLVNDTYGHLIGDQAIKWVATLTSQWKPKHNIDIVRYGGDEFILMIPHSIDVVQNDLELLRQRVTDKPFLIRETGDRIHLTISIGACFTNEEPCMLKELFKQADDALYRAKRDGRNRLYIQQYKKETAETM